MTKDPASNSLYWWFAIGGFIVALAPLASTPVLPIIDFYNHVARFYVLAHIGTSPLLQMFYRAHWTLLPDIGVDVVGTPILFFAPPLLAAKLIAIGILANLYGSLLFFNRALAGRSSILLSLLLLPLLYSYIFNWGFANFLLGLGLDFWAAAWWLRLRGNLKLAVPLACLWSVVIFFSHGVAFLLYGVLLVSLEIGIFVQSAERKLGALIRALTFVAIQAVIPIGYFLIWKAGLAAGGEVGALTNQSAPPFLHRFANAMAYHANSVVRVEEGPSFNLDVATFVLQAAALAYLIRQGKISLVQKAWPALVAATILAILPVPTLFGVGYIADRLPLFAVLCFFGAISVQVQEWRKGTLVAVGVLVGVVVVRLSVVATNWHGYASIYKEFQTIATKIPAGSMTASVMVGAGHHETDVPRCEMYGPLLISVYGQVGPLFADEKQQPLAMIGRLKTAVDGDQVPAGLMNSRMDENSRAISIAATAGFDQILVCNAQLLRHPLPPGVHLVEQTSHFALLEPVRLTSSSPK